MLLLLLVLLVLMMMAIMVIKSSLKCMRMNYIWLTASCFHEGFCKGHLKPLEDNSSTCLSFPVFHVVLQLYFDKVFFFVCNLLRTALDL